MKIDLHVHTKATKKGEPQKRNIEKNLFLEKLYSSDVGIAAITNHNEIDIEQYENFSNNDKNILVLPGVEIDVLKNNQRRQVNIISNPDDVYYLKSFLDTKLKIDNKNKVINYEDFIKFIQEDKKGSKWIYLFDHKNGKTKWLKEELEELRNKLRNNILIIDVNNPRTFEILKSVSFKAMIGSDVQNWDEYEKKSSKLIETKLYINNYNNLFNILNYKLDELNDSILKEIKNYEIKPIKMEGTKYFVDGIKIKSGVNIIFGAKRTGKTEILKGINKQFKEKSIIYESSGQENNIEDLKKGLLLKNKFVELKDEFYKKIESIKEYKEIEYKDFQSFYNYYNVGNKNNKIVFHNEIKTQKTFLNNDERKSLEKIEKYSKNIIDIFNDELLNISSHNDFYSEINCWKNQTKILLDFFWNEYKNIKKENWKKEIDIKIRENIEKILRENKGQPNLPSGVGLLERYNYKKKLLEELNDLHTFINKEYPEIVIKKYIIPNRGEIFAKQKISFLPTKNNKRDLKKFNYFVKSQNYMRNFNEIKELVIEMYDSKKISPSEEVILEDSKNNKTFSNGEKAHLCLFDKMETDKEIILLDEPSVFLGSESVSESLVEKISELNKRNQTIVITTHNSTLGINTIPINYIYRKYKENQDECETFVSSIWEKKLINIKDKEDKLDLKKEIINNFEGGKENYFFRKGIYDYE
ncbi:MAG: hypothetical protein TYPL_5150 [Candidatus Tyloplasma litorale]|nr:MAG: hypothetical protein TYPL_5150 [Mycoplasmatales bacterium]